MNKRVALVDRATTGTRRATWSSWWDAAARCRTRRQRGAAGASECIAEWGAAAAALGDGPSGCGQLTRASRRTETCARSASADCRSRRSSECRQSASDLCPTPAIVIVQHLPSAASHQLTVPPHRRVTYGGRAFAVAGPSTWNSLPKHLRDPSLSTSVFGRLLETFSSQSTNV